MKKYNWSKNLTVLLIIWSMMMLPLVAAGQTKIKLSKNKYKIQDDVKIGRDASVEIEKQMPILNDYEASRYVQNIGANLVRAIPREFQHSEFNYQFKIVNARDINAFAVPGGPMYVNRGMIEAAKNEGEMAGVMAHEISHVALRHGTAQATKASNPWNQILGIGAILGGAIVLGEAGAQIGAVGYQAWMTRYSRTYETQADILGAQIMANANYDPRDLANMFKTIEKESGGSRAPEFLSSHPNPENRYENINREADLLRVSERPIRNTREFERVQSKLSRMPKAPSMEEIEKNAEKRTNPTAGGKYNSRVENPSSRTVNYRNGNLVQMRIPNNWKTFETEETITFAPEGAYGDQGITHGTMIGVQKTQKTDLPGATEEYVNGIMQANDYLRKDTGYNRATIDRRQGYMITMSGQSPVTRATEVVTVYTTQLRNGSLFYVITVAPQNESSRYSSAFRNLVNSINLTD